jgi:hypothetical protein
MTMNTAPGRHFIFLVPLLIAAIAGRTIAQPSHKQAWTPQNLANNPDFLRVDNALLGAFTGGVVHAGKADQPAAAITLVKNPAYRGGIGLRAEARTDTEALNTIFGSYNVNLAPAVRGQSVRLSATIHWISGSGIFQQRPRQYDVGDPNRNAFIRADETQRMCNAGDRIRIDQVVRMDPKATMINYYFWFKTTNPYAAEIESLNVELVADQAVQVRPLADSIPSGTRCIYGEVILAPTLWKDGAQPKTILLAVETRGGERVPSMTMKPPAGPVLSEGIRMQARQGYVLALPPKLPPGGCTLSTTVLDTDGKELAKTSHDLTVLPDFLPTK